MTDVDLTQCVLDGLHKLAHSQDMQYTSMGYWQARMRVEFPMKDGYVALCEQSPDDESRRRIDQVIYHIDPGTLMFTKLVMSEGKRKGAGLEHIKEAESQGLSAALKALIRDILPVVYVVTTMRVQFRAWRVRAGQQWLTPLHGPSTEADTQHYLDILSSAGHEQFSRLVEMVMAAISGHELQPYQPTHWKQ